MCGPQLVLIAPCDLSLDVAITIFFIDRSYFLLRPRRLFLLKTLGGPLFVSVAILVFYPFVPWLYIEYKPWRWANDLRSLNLTRLRNYTNSTFTAKSGKWHLVLTSHLFPSFMVPFWSLYSMALPVWEQLYIVDLLLFWLVAFSSLWGRYFPIAVLRTTVITREAPPSCGARPSR